MRPPGLLALVAAAVLAVLLSTGDGVIAEKNKFCEYDVLRSHYLEIILPVDRPTALAIALRAPRLISARVPHVLWLNRCGRRLKLFTPVLGRV